MPVRSVPTIAADLSLTPLEPVRVLSEDVTQLVVEACAAGAETEHVTYYATWLRRLARDPGNVAAIVRMDQARSLVGAFTNENWDDACTALCTESLANVVKTGRANGLTVPHPDTGAPIPIAKDVLDAGGVAMAAAAIGYNPEAWDPTPVSAERAQAGCALLDALATTPEEVRRVVLQEECVWPTALTVVGSPEPS